VPETPRTIVLAALADRIVRIAARRPLRVAIDGHTAAGKTTFADALAAVVAGRGRPTIRTSIDGFHRPRAERYARGHHSPEGYYFDARDLAAVRALLLDPLGPGGDRSYRTACFDLEQDRAIALAPTTAPPDAVLIVDGTFLQRPELATGWDVAIFLRVSPDEAARRLIERDCDLLGGRQAAAELYARRYRPAYDIYSALARPDDAADAVVDNDDVHHPMLAIRASGRLSARTWSALRPDRIAELRGCPDSQ
jgi:uridine kinase